MMEKEDIFFLGIYSGKAYMSYPMNLINDVRMLKIFCYLELEKKIRKTKYEKANFLLYQNSHSFDIFNMFDMYTYVNGMPPLSNEERYSILRTFSLEEKRFLLNNLYPDFSEHDFSVNESFQFKAFEAFLATDMNFNDPPVVYTEKAKFEYLCLNGKQFAMRWLVSCLLCLAATFKLGFVVSAGTILFNLIFLQFGLFIDKLLFQVMYRNLTRNENVDSCRRIWRRLQTYMMPMPTDKFSLALCVEEIKNKKHIEFKFCSDKYDQILGYYRLGDVQLDSEIKLRQFPNTGIFFWISIFSDVKITRRRIKVNSYLSVEKFTPEFFLIDFRYFKPYTENSISRVMSLEALFELVKITIEEDIPGCKLLTVRQGYEITARNTHQRVKISAVARYVFDNLGIGNSFNLTPRYQNLKDSIYKHVQERIQKCKTDMMCPGVVNAVVPFKKSNQFHIYGHDIPSEPKTIEVLDPNYDREIILKPHVASFIGAKGKITLGWFTPYLNYETRTLDVDKFPLPKRQFLLKRLAPLVKADFNYYSGGTTEPVLSRVLKTVVKEPRKIPEYQKKAVDDYPEIEKEGYIHRNITVVPVCEIVPCLKKKVRKEEPGKFMQEVEKRAKERCTKKRSIRLNKISKSILKMRKANMTQIKGELDECGMAAPRNLNYAAKVVERMARARVKASGNLYKRIDKREFNSQIKVVRMQYKRRLREKEANIPDQMPLSKKHSRAIKEMRKKSLSITLAKQEGVLTEYLDPYIADRDLSNVVEDTERFKYFLLRRRLSDYGLPWRRTDISETHETTKNRFRVSRFNAPKVLRNLMRNIVVINERGT